MKTPPPLFAPILSFLLAAILPACQSPHLEIRKGQAVAPQPSAPRLFEWHGDDLSGPVAVRISLSQQKAFITRGGQDAGWTYIASGRSRYPTPPGRYRILDKKADKHSNKYGMIVNSAGSIIDGDAAAGREPVPKGGRFLGAPMPYWMRLTSYGIGMHAGPIPDPGYPASHGCIRLPLEMAETLFSITPVGAPVTVEP